MKHIETIAIHASNAHQSHEVIQPISLSTTFIRNEAGNYDSNHMYSRISNSNRDTLENTLTQLESGQEAAAFASGNAAGMSVFQALTPGSHVIAPDDMYHGLRNLLKIAFKDILEVDFVDQTDIENIKKALKANTQLIWIETPSNPFLKLTDLKASIALAQKHQIKIVVDNTFATPYLQNPLLMGADMVMHSSTKYLGGHSDVLGGALITRENNPFWDKIKFIQSSGGAVPSPFDCYLLCRSIKTFPYRMRGHCENAGILAQYFETHAAVASVRYPGLSSHPQHQLAKSQMRGFGGMLSILLNGGENAAHYFVNHLKLFTQATSLGGVESLVEHRYSVEGPDSKTPKNLVRISVGLEHIDDLIADCEKALKIMVNG